MKYLRQLAGPIPVEPVVVELAALEGNGFWNEYRLRTAYEASPHHVDDLWVRYRDWSEWIDIKRAHQHKPLHGMETVDDCTRLERLPYREDFAIAQFVGESHESVWYPVIRSLPSLKSLIFETMRYFECERLGGVLITRIPPGGEVKPHRDGGWHATYYEKIAVQLKSAPGQAFCYADGQFECEPGTVYAFDNSQEHWVSNRSDVERITCIICVKRDVRLKPLWCGPGESHATP